MYGSSHGKHGKQTETNHFFPNINPSSYLGNLFYQLLLLFSEITFANDQNEKEIIQGGLLCKQKENKKYDYIVSWCSISVFKVQIQKVKLALGYDFLICHTVIFRYLWIMMIERDILSYTFTSWRLQLFEYSMFLNRYNEKSSYESLIMVTRVLLEPFISVAAWFCTS